jgi:hypothetical protein
VITPLRLALAFVCLLPLAAAAHADDGGSRAVTQETGSDTTPAIACDSLVGLEIPASVIGLPTSGGEVTRATRAIAQGRPYCQPQAVLRPVDPTAPPITMRMGLPDQWNRRTIMFGGGGYNGSVPAPDGAAPAPNAGVPFGDERSPLGRGMVTYASDSGHTNSPLVLPTLDGSFAMNDEALRNFAGDALKKTHDAAMFVVSRYYAGTAPEQSYFAGGSTGGREGLAVAQRWPQDFDGVISVYPAFNAATLDLFFGIEAREFAKPDAFPNTAQQRLLYESVIASCDPLDGAKDGLISDEAGCDFDPSTLRCPGGVNLHSACLSDPQIAAVKRVSSPVRFDYPLASGETGYPGFPFLSGADMTTPLLGMGTTAPDEPEPATAGYGPQFWGQWVKYFVTRDPSYDNLSLDPLAPGKWQDRISELTALQDVNDPNLAPFADQGGKLLVLHGTADELVSHRATVEYYQRVQATLGAERTRQFSRLYLIPGANHANVEPAFSASWDSLTALESWVRDGVAPQSPVVRDANPGANRTRPLCEYDAYPRYVGEGDVNQASSFACTARAVPLDTAIPPAGTAPAAPSAASAPSAGPASAPTSATSAVRAAPAGRSLAATGADAALPAAALLLLVTTLATRRLARGQR